MAVDPVARFRRWFAEASRARVPLPEAIALATASAAGRPVGALRLAEAGRTRRLSCSFTDGGSRKGRELAQQPVRLVCVLLGSDRQAGARRRARIEVVTARGGRCLLGDASAWQSARRALASRQSRTAGVDEAYAHPSLAAAPATATPTAPVPRPRRDGGAIASSRVSIEFWTRGKDRLHHREVFRRTRAAVGDARSGAAVTAATTICSDCWTEFAPAEFHVVRRRALGLTAFIALDDLRLGPACGGIRWRRLSPVLTDRSAHDVLRLARAMTYKNCAGGPRLRWRQDGRVARSDALDPARAFPGDSARPSRDSVGAT